MIFWGNCDSRDDLIEATLKLPRRDSSSPTPFTPSPPLPDDDDDDDDEDPDE